MHELGELDLGASCSRCGALLIYEQDLRGGAAVRVPLVRGGFAHYRWCAACLDRRRQRSKRFGMEA